MTTAAIQEGDRVECLRGNIEKNAGAGLVGVVTSFARFSPYHGREAHVIFGKDAWDPHPANGWFWLCDVKKAGA